MLLHLPGGRFVAYSQKCTHLSCAVYYQPERERLYCPCHEGVFDPRPASRWPGRRSAGCRASRCGRRADMLYRGRRRCHERPRRRERRRSWASRAPRPRRDQPPPPGQSPIVMAALAIGMLLMAIQLWLLTVALDLYLAGQGRSDLGSGAGLRSPSSWAAC